MIPFRLIAAFWPALRGTVLRSRAFPGLLGGGGAAPGPLSEDPWPADPAVAHALLTGSVPVHGLALPAAEVWRASQEHAPATAAALHGFGWLDDLRAHATP
ncbi:MAG: hypothetical protein KDE22_02765, partial [Rhodobacterales bacterium]|nr:hypothetical protein [Rhodobacterales bacterium]